MPGTLEMINSEVLSLTYGALVSADPAPAPTLPSRPRAPASRHPPRSHAGFLRSDGRTSHDANPSDATAQVRQLVDDIGDVEQVNERLDSAGHSIGLRVVDEFLARSGTQRCSR